MKNNNKQYYFVYGTLKEGHYNHRVLNGSKKVGEFSTEPEFTMLHLGGFPGIVRNGNTSIQGELYEVTDKVTEQGLDRLEGYRENGSNNLYNKEVINIDGKDAFIYTFNEDRININNYKTIESGKWE